MGYEELESREYKVMLDPARFGGPDTLSSGAAALWEALQGELGNASELTGDGTAWQAESPRAVTFWDTADFAVYARDFVLRRRLEDGGGKVTLKKRSPDRVLAAHNGIRKGDSEDAGFELERKFEEDIKLTDDGRMRSLFSHTIDWEDPPADIDLARLAVVEEVFPGFCEAVGLDDGVLAPIGGIVVTEHVLELDKARLAGASIGVGLSVWYRDTAEPPCVAEFSYKYEADERDFDPEVAAAAFDVLTALGRMHAWRPSGERTLTKTRWVYAQAGLVESE